MEPQAPAVTKIQVSLEPYIKQREETLKIRRVLTAFLDSHVKPQNGLSICSPCSLILNKTYEIEALSSGAKGIRREYLRSLRAYSAAQKVFAEAKNGRQLSDSDISDQGFHINSGASVQYTQPDAPIERFTLLVNQQRKAARLKIAQKYVDLLSQQPAAAFDHLDPKAMLRNTLPLPQISLEVMGNTQTSNSSVQNDPRELIDQLEKAVLRSKVLLKREQTLLAKLRITRELPRKVSTASQSSRLEALGTTRNELINWIETELSKAGEASPTPDDKHNARHEENNNTTTHLLSSKKNYSQYTKARESLLSAANNKSNNTGVLPIDQSIVVLPKTKPTAHMKDLSYLLLPRIQDLIATSNKQKSTIQQKQFVSASLALQLKEADDSLNRMADESHLLPSHLLPAQPPRDRNIGSLNSLEDMMLSAEKAKSTLRIQNWITAAEAAGTSSGKITASKMEESEEAIGSLDRILSELYFLIGKSQQDDRPIDEANQTSSAKDIWASLNGKLGGLKSEAIETP